MGCRRIKGSHNFLNIAEVINEICDTLQINYSKITHIIIDNASNFGKAYYVFSKGITPVTYDSNYVGNLCNDTNLQYDNDFSNSDSESISFNNIDNLEYIDVGFVLSESNNINNPEYNNVCLPNNMTCCAHTLNLIATTDISKITDKNYLKISKLLSINWIYFGHYLVEIQWPQIKFMTIAKLNFLSQLLPDGIPCFSQ